MGGVEGEGIDVCLWGIVGGGPVGSGVTECGGVAAVDEAGGVCSTGIEDAVALVDGEGVDGVIGVRVISPVGSGVTECGGVAAEELVACPSVDDPVCGVKCEGV